MSKEITSEKIFSVREASKYLIDKYGIPARVSPSYLHTLAGQGKGPDRVKIGKYVGYTAEALDKWHNSRIETIKADKPKQGKK